MKRKLIFLSLTLILAFSGVVYAAGINGTYEGKNVVKVTLDGREIPPDNVPGYLEDGNTMVPLGLLRKMGITVDWDQQTLTANVKLPTRTAPVLIQSQLDELSKAVYLVHAENPDPTKVSQGSGFIVNGTLITNYHVGGGSAWTKALIDGNWQQTSSYAFANKDIDLMGFKVSGGRQLPIATELPEPGDPVYSIGWPAGAMTVTEGEIYRVYDDEIVHTAKTAPGSSGGMLLSGRGEIIGINKQGTTAGTNNFTWAIPIQTLQNELNK